MLLLASLLLLAAPSPIPPASGDAPPIRAAADTVAVAITEWTVPWEKSRPRDPYVAPDGRVWFVGQVGNYVAVLDPKSGKFQRFELEDGALPHNLVVDGKGQVWYAGNGNGHIGRLDPATGKVTRFAMPDGVRDPHTLVFDRAGNLWFTAQQSARIGRLTTATGKVDVASVAARSRPYGIEIDAKGTTWVVLFGTNTIVSVDPKSMALREYKLPHEAARPRRIALTSDGRVWYVDYTRGFLGRLDPATGKVDEWANPLGPRSLPYAMAVDDRDRLWFVETGNQPNRLVGFDPRASKFFSITDIAESGAGTVRHMVFHKPTRTIWFGTDAGTIGRATVP